MPSITQSEKEFIMREYTNKEESRVNFDNEEDFKKIYLEIEEECEIVPSIAPHSRK